MSLLRQAFAIPTAPAPAPETLRGWRRCRVLRQGCLMREPLRVATPEEMAELTITAPYPPYHAWLRAFFDNL